MSSAFTRIPIHHNVNSRKSGAGKSYDLVLVAEYFPQKYVFPLTGMSSKAMLHEGGLSVIEDKSTGEAEPADPIIESLKIRIKELTAVCRKRARGSKEKGDI